MGKLSTKCSFSKATLTKTGNTYIISECTKEGRIDYDLSAILDTFVGDDNISLSINADTPLSACDSDETEE